MQGQAGYDAAAAFQYPATGNIAAPAGIFLDSFGKSAAIFALIIVMGAQFFCGMASVTTNSRMIYAFSRDGAVPGHRWWHSINKRTRTPTNAIWLAAVLAWFLVAPAYWLGSIVAYFAVTAVGVIGLYIAYIIPIFLRRRAGDAFQEGPWKLGKWSALIGWIAVIWVALIVVILMLPQFNWGDGIKFIDVFNFTPVIVGGVFIITGLWWVISAHKWFTGPKVQGTAEELAAIEADLELKHSLGIDDRTGRGGPITAAAPRSFTVRRPEKETAWKSRACSARSSSRNWRRRARSTPCCACSPTCRAGSWASAILPDFFLEEILGAEGLHACLYLLAVDMEMEPLPGYEYASWETGYGDFRMMPDMATLRLCPWLEKTAMVICDIYAEDEDVPVPVAPRQILKDQLAKAAEDGLHGQDRLGAGVLPVQGRLRRAGRARVPRRASVEQLHHGLPHAPDHQGRVDHPPDPQPHAWRGHPDRVLQGRVRQGPARDQHHLLRRARRTPTTTRSTSTA